MSRVFATESGRYYTILGIGIFALAALLFGKMEKVRALFAPYLKETTLYLFGSLLLFAMPAFAAWLLQKTISYLGYFLLFQTYFLALGASHVLLMRRFLSWIDDSHPFWLRMSFTAILGLLGSIVFMTVYRQVHHTGFELTMAGATIIFLLPYLVQEAFIRALDIPPPDVKRWYYPIHETIEEPNESKLKNLLIISFEFQKHPDDMLFTSFRSKAPNDMDFGLLFYFFINDYNERHPDNRIQVADGSGAAHGWTFYRKRSWYSLRTRYINFDDTIYINRIREKDVIVCSRAKH